MALQHGLSLKVVPLQYPVFKLPSPTSKIAQTVMVSLKIMLCVCFSCLVYHIIMRGGGGYYKKD